MTASGATLDVAGPAAPPRANGELVFAEPWHARAFGLVMALVESGALAYDDFRAHLIAEVPRHASFYDAWVAALERAVVDTGAVTCEQVDGAVSAHAARPAGHDH